jgi:hypothetical protein
MLRGRLLPRARRISGRPADLPVRLHQGPGRQGNPAPWCGRRAVVSRGQTDPEADMESGLAVRPLVHAGRRRHRERQHIEKLRVTRAELNDLLDLPGYNQSEIRAVLDEYGAAASTTTGTRPTPSAACLKIARTRRGTAPGMISMMEFNGNVQGPHPAELRHGCARRASRLPRPGLGDRLTRHQVPSQPEPAAAPPVLHHVIREGARHAGWQRL